MEDGAVLLQDRGRRDPRRAPPVSGAPSCAPGKDGQHTHHTSRCKCACPSLPLSAAPHLSPRLTPLSRLAQPGALPPTFPKLSFLSDEQRLSTSAVDRGRASVVLEIHFGWSLAGQDQGRGFTTA